MRFKKGDNIVATNLDTNTKFVFKCPFDTCKVLLKRFVVMDMGHPSDVNYLFVKQN